MKKILFGFFLLGLMTGNVFAGQYDIKEMTPEVSRAISSRQARYSQLQQLKAQGVVVENNRGYVEALGPGAESVVASENADRRVIYQTIVQQNGFGPEGLAQVERAFAEVQREKAGRQRN